MELVLNKSDFVHSKYSVRYGDNKEAHFILVDESFPGMNIINRVNKIIILTRTVHEDGSVSDVTRQSAIIGFGNKVVGVRSADLSLRGKEFNKDNMEACTVILYEDD